MECNKFSRGCFTEADAKTDGMSEMREKKELHYGIGAQCLMCSPWFAGMASDALDVRDCVSRKRRKGDEETRRRGRWEFITSATTGEADDHGANELIPRTQQKGLQNPVIHQPHALRTPASGSPFPPDSLSLSSLRLIICLLLCLALCVA